MATMRKLVIEGQEWKWQLALASGKLIIRNPDNWKHEALLTDALPAGQYVYDRYEQGYVLHEPVTPKLVTDYILANKSTLTEH